MTPRRGSRAGVAAALAAVLGCGGRSVEDAAVCADASPHDAAGPSDAFDAGVPVPPRPTVDADLLRVPPPIVLEVPSDGGELLAGGGDGAGAQGLWSYR